MSRMHQWWVVPGADGGELERREVEIPHPGPGQVLVAIRGAGVNRGEIIGRAALRTTDPTARSRPSGIEFAGVIAAIGDGVMGWSVGNRVMGRGAACHAEYSVVDASALMRIPGHLSDAEAAAIPNVFVTAHDALVTAAGMRANDAVLISAGSSGVGTAAIQIARYLGARLVAATTRSPAKASALMGIGATHIVDTTAADWAEQARRVSGGIDVVIDLVGGSLFPGLLATMAVGGRYISVGRNDGRHSTIDLDWVALNRLSLIGVTFRTRTPQEAFVCSQRFVTDLLGAFEAGRLRPVLDRAFALDDLPSAHAYMLANNQFGKIILET